nr:hypothetical protein [Mannheimia haemolytica]
MHNGHAYVAADGDVMFDVESFQKYRCIIPPKI